MVLSAFKCQAQKLETKRYKNDHFISYLIVREVLQTSQTRKSKMYGFRPMKYKHFPGMAYVPSLLNEAPIP